MSIPVNAGNATITYQGDGVTSLYVIPFTFTTAGEIAVYLNDVPAAAVTVLGAGDPIGGIAVFASPPAMGVAVRIRRVQTVHVSSNDRIAESLVNKLIAGPGIQLTEQNDGDNEKLQIAIVGNFVPAGAVVPFAGAEVPSRWLFCDGAAVDRAAYAALFDVIGTTYGGGDGSTTFNLPDLRGRVVAGKDDMGGTAANRLTPTSAAGLNGSALGAGGGDQQHYLIQTEVPDNVLDPINNGSGSIVERANNHHSGQAASAHNNVQPTLILNYIIKT